MPIQQRTYVGSQLKRMETRTKNAGEIGYCVLLDGEAVPTSSRLKGGAYAA
jgi:hypothetical protein